MSRRDAADPTAPLPPDDLTRALVRSRTDDAALPHIGIAGDTYTILLSGRDTDGRFTLIDMHVPPGGGPAPHRHDFEETFTILDGRIEVTFRDQTLSAEAGETINVPANAPHAFRNVSDRPARLLCLAAPAGLEELFAAIGVPVAHRTQAPPRLDAAGQAAFIAKAKAAGPRYRTQLLPPPPDRP